MARQFLVTAALPYSNGRLHVGHIAGAYLPADIYVRYLRARGEDVRFICGSDDNGVAITLTAMREDVSPLDIVNKYNHSQQQAFEGLGIHFDVFGGTHMPDFVYRHNELSQEFFRSIHEKGYFSKRPSRQLYDTKVERFLPDRFVTGTCHHPDCGAAGAYGDQCEACGRTIDPLLLKSPKSVLTDTTPEIRETTHWYLRLSDFQEPLRHWLEGRAGWRPTVLNFSLGQINSGLPERAMTRDLDWGVPVPLDDPDAAGKVLYVWFDAPIGYVSFTAQLLENQGGDWRDYAHWWKDPDCKIVHFIGEDNIIFHALIWPAMLMAEGSYQLPHNVVANSFLNIQFAGSEEEKISKSRGNAIWIEDYLEQYDPDPLRYYLTAIAPEAARTAYNPDEFRSRNDTELVATLGNFINRTVTFAHRYFEGRVPAVGERDSIDNEQLAICQQQADRTAEALEGYRFKAALGEVMALARAGNLYLDQKKPWVQRKQDMQACGTTINVCLQIVKALAVVMQPFLPFAARKTVGMLSLGEEALSWSEATVEVAAGHPLAEAEILFRKLQDAP